MHNKWNGCCLVSTVFLGGESPCKALPVPFVLLCHLHGPARSKFQPYRATGASAMFHSYWLGWSKRERESRGCQYRRTLAHRLQQSSTIFGLQESRIPQTGVVDDIIITSSCSPPNLASNTTNRHKSRDLPPPLPSSPLSPHVSHVHIDK